MSDSDPRPLNTQAPQEDEDLAESLEDEPTQEEAGASDEEAVEDDQTSKADDADEAPSGPSLRDAYTSDRDFSDFPLSPELLQGIAELGYKKPTRVQAMTIEPGLAGKDMLVRSKTGTGKTAAFCVPMIERIEAGCRKTSALVLTPTRELALQVAAECAGIAKYKDIRVTAIYGGVGFGPQEDALRDGTEIIVATPGRILDHLRRRNLDPSSIATVVLDEADEMLSMGFFEDVKKILDSTPAGRQMFLFSATVDDRVKGLMNAYMTDPEDLMISTDADKVEGITHVLYETTPDFHKVRALLALLEQEQPKSAIIFCNTREDTATVQAFLSRQGVDAEIISGDLPQKQRERVMAGIKRGEVQYLVATDVAARGIDISDLSHVINYSLPEDPAIYLHRTGRTGRIGKTGIAISLVGGPDIGTRNALTKTYQIQFVVKPLPTPEEADRLRVARQIKAVQRAMGHMAFEGYLGTVRALKNTPEADMLFAATLRAFFLWDRMRKAAEIEEETGEAPRERRSDDRGDRGDRGGRGGDRRERRSDDRGDRGGRGGDRRERRDGPRDDRRSDRRDGPAPRREDRPPRPEDRREPPTVSAEPAPEPIEAGGPPVDGEARGESGEAKRRRRRRRGGRGGREGEAGGEGGEAQGAESQGGGDSPSQGGEGGEG